MDEGLCYYGTFCALSLIGISFYWLHKNDEETRLALRNIKEQKLAVLIVNSSHHIYCDLKRKLEEKGFVVYDIYFIEAKQVSKYRSGIKIDLTHSNHIDEAVNFIKSKLKPNNQILHAYLSLPTIVEANADHSDSPIELFEEILMPKFNLLTSFLDTLKEHKTRVIHIQDSACPNIDLSRLIRSVESGINRFLCKELRQVGESLMCEVNVRESDADAGLFESFTKALANYRADMNQKVERRLENLLELKGSFADCMTLERQSDTILLKKNPKIMDDSSYLEELELCEKIRKEEKIVQVIKRLVIQVFPPDMSLIV